jgi:glutamyl-tRNA synthetase
MSAILNSSPVITRFAPSPTGSLHLGNARTAFFSYLWARKSGGRFILRIEDTDAERSRLRFRDELMAELRWLGLDWDEGPDIGGPSAPYSQAERGEFYRTLFAQLEMNDQAYPCYCTAEELELSRKLQRMSGKPPRYAGTCRHLTSAQRAEREARGLGGRSGHRVHRHGARAAAIRIERYRRLHHSARQRHFGILLLQRRR